MALYRIGNHIYTPIYPDVGAGIAVKIFEVDGTKAIFSTQSYANMEVAKEASRMMLGSLKDISKIYDKDSQGT